MIKLNLLDDHSEIVPYNFSHFPIHSRKYWLSYYPNMKAANHWHNDIELIVILKGKMAYCVNGKEYILHQDEGIFVNSKQMHYGYAIDGGDCQFLCTVLPVSLLYATEFVKSSYIDSLCSNASYPLLLLTSSVKWHREIIHSLKTLYDLCNKQETGFELAAVSLFFSLWLQLYQNIDTQPASINSSPSKSLEALHSMTGYIQRNYHNKMTLSEIAASGNVCRSSCCDIFSSILSMTPITYLTRFRLEKSIELIHNPSLSITDIALQCGFNSSSYYTEVFRREMGITPSQYRKLDGIT